MGTRNLLLLVVVVGAAVLHVRGETRERMVVYLHDTTLYRNASFNTATQAVRRSPTMSSKGSQFGSVYVFEDPLTSGAAMGSPKVGSAQGMYVYTGRSTVASLWAFTAFLGKRGSISVMGAEYVLQPSSRVLPIVGGTGDFALARGQVNLSTVAFKVPTYFVLSLHFTVLLP